MAEFERDEHEHGGGFMMGLLTGTVLGAGLGMLLAPKSGRELRQDIGEQASSLGRAAGEGFRRAADAASGLAGKPGETMGEAGAAVREALERSELGSEERAPVTATGGNESPAPAEGSTYTGNTERF
jgi:gas vesicle protein